MRMDLSVKIDNDILTKAVEEKDNFLCKRRQVRFDFMNGKWSYGLTCDGYGNGYGISMPCSTDCKLRITDLDKCENIEHTHGSYLIQKK